MLQLQRPCLPHAVNPGNPQSAFISPAPAFGCKRKREQSPPRSPLPQLVHCRNRQARPSRLGNSVPHPDDMRQAHTALPEPHIGCFVQITASSAADFAQQHAQQAMSGHSNSMAATLGLYPPPVYQAPAAYPSPPNPTLKSRDNSRSSNNTNSTGNYINGIYNAPDTPRKEIPPYLQKLPSSIAVPGTNFLQLTAEIACLLWFEDAIPLKYILHTGQLPRDLVRSAYPTCKFRKWVTVTLCAMQPTQNVIILALLFIYRLKLYKSVQGKPGSECRVLTVGLMLANKFLDDSAYSPRTWADVSGIPIKEIHAMEIEFLSNMKYDLFTSAGDWDDWHSDVSKFGRFLLTRPTTREQPNPPPQPSPAAGSPVSPLPGSNGRSASRKRRYDEPDQEPIPKRSRAQFDSWGSQRVYTSDTRHHPGPSQPNAHAAMHAPQMLPPYQWPATTLPPLNGMCASSSYPPSSQWPQPSSSSSSSSSLSLPPAISIPQLQSAHTGLSRPSTYHADPAQISPVPAQFGSAAPKPKGPSPSSYSYPQHDSPYHPVRMDTLLAPSNSTSINHMPHLRYDQIHYQPLGKPLNQRCSGNLPYMSREAWPRANQYVHHNGHP